ncbi:hypothetical protein RHO15_08910 [Utexia brackfieldae]|uniref:hypothetical protein n=1 Tax=Utexia brackfieldae TaxID=3074108 RepID=UPI00370DC70D
MCIFIDDAWVEDEVKKFDYQNKLLPIPVTKRQLMLQLNKINLYHDVINFILDDENIEIKIDFDCSVNFNVNSALIKAIAARFKLENIEDILISASNL